MGFVDVMLGLCGFGLGLSSGIVIGYCFFILFQPSDVKEPKIRPLVEHDTQSLERIFPEIPLWVKNPDYDRIDWLNKFLELMWPHLEKAICRTAEQVARPIIAENIVKYKISSVELEAFTLGSLPPTFHGVKVYITEEKELIMEPSLKWAGNTNVLVVVKAYGLKLTIQPYIDFGLKFMGADLMAIPGLYKFVQETIKKQVADMYLWPRTLEVPVLDITNAFKKPVGILHVKVLRAYNLRKKDLMGKSDPYVKLKLSDDKLPSKKTSVKHNNLNPEWNEEFKFIIKDPENQLLELNVFDWEQVGKHDKMGMNIIRLKDLTPNQSKTLKLDLLKNLEVESDKSRGQITMELLYKPFKEDKIPQDVGDNEAQKPHEDTPSGGGLFVVIVHEAQDLEGKHHTNPYAQITFRGEEKKTRYIKKKRDPCWEEEFQFVCEEPPTNDKIHVEVFSRPPSISIHPKERLGYVTINLADVVNNKRTNERYHLIDSKNGRIQIELQWRTS